MRSISFHKNRTQWSSSKSDRTSIPDTIMWIVRHNVNVSPVIDTSRSCPHSWLIPLSSPPVFSGVRIARSLVLCVCVVDGCLSFCTFSFGHCVVCSSSIYGFWLPLYSGDLLCYVYVLYIAVCPFVLFLLAIVLSVLRFLDSDYPFGIFKLFFSWPDSREIWLNYTANKKYHQVPNVSRWHS